MKAKCVRRSEGKSDTAYFMSVEVVDELIGVILVIFISGRGKS